MPLLSYGEKPDWFYRISPSGLLPVRERERESESCVVGSGWC